MNSYDKYAEMTHEGLKYVEVSNTNHELDNLNHEIKSKAQKRKDIPVFSGVLNYFPDAILAIASCSKKGNDQHNPNKPLHWDRSKSGDEKDALTRHLIESGTIDTDGIRHSTKVAWRSLANLQKELEEAGEAPNSIHNKTYL